MNVEIINKSSIVKMNMKDIVVENIVSIMMEEHGTSNSFDGVVTVPRRLFIFLSYHIPNNILKEDEELSVIAVTVDGDATSTSVSVVKWEVECMFCILNDLNRIIENSTHNSNNNSKSTQSSISIVKLATNIIPTMHHAGNTILAEFPKNFEKLKNHSLLGSLGMASMSINMSSMMGGTHHHRTSLETSHDDDKKKRKMLISWLQDVMHNFDFLPVEAKTLLIELVHKSKLVSKDEPTQPESSPKQSHQPSQNTVPGRSISPRLSHKESASIVSPVRNIAEQLSSSVRDEQCTSSIVSQSVDRNNQKSVPKSKVRNSVEVATITVPFAKSGDLEVPKALCISRNERILSGKQLQPYSSKYHVVKLAVVGAVLIVGTSPLSLEWLVSLSLPLKILTFSALCLLYVIYEEEDTKRIVEDKRRRDVYGYVESIIRDFFQRGVSVKDGGCDLDLQAIIFNTESQQPYIPAPPVVQGAKTAMNPLLRNSSLFLSNAVSAVSFTFNRQKTQVLPADAAVIPQAVPISEEEEALESGAIEEPGGSSVDSIFEDFHFSDIAPAARDIYIDRRYIHNFQVRGKTYKMDGKKIHPGSAICKCMLMELYEVEAKDGDRHDHVVSRGAAKERMEAIAALPGNPFQMIINFQIPGDPPVSIVAFFAVPPSVINRDNISSDDEISKFMRLFKRFINIPETETDRLAAWGIREEPSAVEGAERVSIESSQDGSLPESAPAPSSSTAWKMPSDISWPDPHEPGALPQDDFRNMRFKLVPLVTEGPWIIRATVPAKPALLGKKLVQRYFRGSNYLEIDLHVGSSTIASQIVGLCRGSAKHFAADVGIVIQGEEEAELPEKMLACVSFHKIDLDVRKKLD